MKNITTINSNTANILVVGDIMLDQYWDGSVDRVSPEAPVPVVKLTTVKNIVGGAGNVATNIAALGGKVKILSVVGKDEHADILFKLLEKSNVEVDFFAIDNYPTTTKLRIVSHNQQLLRVDTEEKLQLNVEQQQKFLNKYTSLLEGIDVIVLSDYNKGALANITQLISLAKEKNITVIVDPKLKDFSAYSNADIITPNLKEIEAVVGEVRSDTVLDKKVSSLCKKLNIANIIVTKSSKGVSIVSKDKAPIHLSATSSDVFDVTGAGDTVIATLAYFINAKLDIKDAVTLANYAAGIAVSKPGTAIVTLEEIKQKSKEHLKIPTGIVNESELVEAIKLCQLRGEKVVFVNGCYDIIHHGHIKYLERAKQFGDRLVIGVNADESIKRLKGDSRPINDLNSRMQVLAGIKAVDWVVAFAEDTPGALVEKLNPDVLVKTTESFKTVADVPDSEGARHVLARGGNIYLLDRTDGCSSSEIIEKSKATLVS